MLKLGRNTGDIMSKKKSEKKEIKSKKKFLIIFFVVIFLLVSSGIGGFFYYQSKSLKVKIKKKIEVSLNEKIYNTDAIISIINGKVITKKKTLDTTKVGSYSVNLKVKNQFKNIKKYSFQLTVVDKEAPKITFNPNLSVEEGQEIDLLKDVTVEDDSKEEIKVTVEGEYDLNTPSTYSLFYVAKDSSGNEAREPFSLEVTKKPEVKPIYAPAVPAPAEGSHPSRCFAHSVLRSPRQCGHTLRAKRKGYPSCYSPRS